MNFSSRRAMSHKNHYQTEQKHQDRNTIDAVHYTDIKIDWVAWVVGVVFFKYPYKIRKNFAYLEILFDAGHNLKCLICFTCFTQL